MSGPQHVLATACAAISCTPNQCAHPHAPAVTRSRGLQVRMLCRRQFFARARGLKVASLQQRAGPVPIGGGGSHPSQGACQLVHGDSWSHSPSVHMR